MVAFLVLDASKLCPWEFVFFTKMACFTYIKQHLPLQCLVSQPQTPQLLLPLLLISKHMFLLLLI